MLFIPGSLTSPAVFEGIGEVLPCQSAVIDWMKSDGPWELDIIGERVLELIVQLGLGPVILCGYSSGGVIALSAALRDEEGRINGLMISNTGANTKGHSDPNLPNQIRDHWPEEDVIRKFISRCFVKECPEELFQRLLAYASGIKKEAALACTLSSRTLDLEPDLQRVKCPVLIAHGKDDLVRRECHVEVLRNNLPDVEVRYLDGGHTIMVEDREHYTKALLYFMEKTLGITHQQT